MWSACAALGTVVNRAVLSLRSRLDQKLEYYPLIRSFGSYPTPMAFRYFPSVPVKSWPAIWKLSRATT